MEIKLKLKLDEIDKPDKFDKNSRAQKLGNGLTSTRLIHKPGSNGWLFLGSTWQKKLELDSLKL